VASGSFCKLTGFEAEFFATLAIGVVIDFVVCFQRIIETTQAMIATQVIIKNQAAFDLVGGSKMGLLQCGHSVS
jgi:hypothetical protein